ncbi:MAG: glycosyltransferase [Thermodesulfobacteriota bacterium]
MNNPSISVIIPTYNRPGYLVQAVHSVLAQTLPVTEIIIVDDGSDVIHRPAICRLETIDKRIKVYLLPENKGASAARNFGLDRSSGNFILFLDDDDLINPNMILKCTRRFQEDTKIDIVACWHAFFYDRTNPDIFSDTSPPSPEQSHSILFTQKYLSFPTIEQNPFTSLMQICIQVSSCLIKKESLQNIRFPEELARNEDCFFWLTLAASGRNFRIHNECLAYHRIHPFASLSRSDTANDAHKFYNKIVKSRLVRHKKDLLLMHIQYSIRLRHFDKSLAIYHAAMFLKYFLQPSVFRSEWKTICHILITKISHRWRISQARKVIIASRSGHA